VRRRYRFLERSLHDPAPLQHDTSLDYERWRGEQLAGLEAINPSVDRDESRRRDDAGHPCWVTLSGGRPVHYRWSATTALYLPFLRLTWHPEPGDYLIFDVFSAPGARGHGLTFDSFLAELFRWREHGLKRSLCLIAWWNQPALRPSFQLGFTATGAVTLWHFGVRRFHTVEGRARWRGDELHLALS
jgi:hypothetical protein